MRSFVLVTRRDGTPPKTEMEDNGTVSMWPAGMGGPYVNLDLESARALYEALGAVLGVTTPPKVEGYRA